MDVYVQLNRIYYIPINDLYTLRANEYNRPDITVITSTRVVTSHRCYKIKTIRKLWKTYIIKETLRYIRSRVTRLYTGNWK